MSGPMNKFTIHLNDESALRALRVVLAYESALRGRTIGQVCSDLVLQVAKVDEYPQEVRERLEEIAEDSARRAVTKSLKASGNR